MGGEVDFLPANEHKSFLQVDSIFLGLLSQACLKVPRTISLEYLCNISMNLNVNLMNLIFCLQYINVNGFFKLLSSF